jgi:hypothetical protein
MANHKWIPQFKLIDQPEHMKDCLPCKIAIGCGTYCVQKYNRKQMNTPKGMVCMHECDRGAGSREKDGSFIGVCCEPTHLKNGTPKENTQDMIKKGRGLTFEHQSKYGKIAHNHDRTCPYCGHIGKGANIFRYHFNNCKFTPTHVQSSDTAQQ